MGKPHAKPHDPNYWRKYRASHPEYRKREQERVVKRRRNLGREDRRSEYLTRGSRAAPPLPTLHQGHPIFERAHALVVGFLKPDTRRELYDPIFEDLVSEAVVALLEHKDPAARTRQYMKSERLWRAFTLPLFVDRE